ncbi:MAG: hypothetical protein WD035_04270 [Balneolaceae bacterium]
MNMKSPVSFTRGEVVYRKYTPPDRDEEESGGYTCGGDPSRQLTTGFWYCDLLPEGVS